MGSDQYAFACFPTTVNRLPCNRIPPPLCHPERSPRNHFVRAVCMQSRRESQTRRGYRPLTTDYSLRRHPERSRGIHSALALCTPAVTTLPRGLLSHGIGLSSKAFPFPAIGVRSFDFAQDDGQEKRWQSVGILTATADYAPKAHNQH